MENEEVHYVDIGYRFKNGKKTAAVTIRAHVKMKKSLEYIEFMYS